MHAIFIRQKKQKKKKTVLQITRIFLQVTKNEFLKLFQFEIELWEIIFIHFFLNEQTLLSLK